MYVVPEFCIRKGLCNVKRELLSYRDLGNALYLQSLTPVLSEIRMSERLSSAYSSTCT